MTCHLLHQVEAIPRLDVAVNNSDGDEVYRLAGSDPLETRVPQSFLVIRNPPRAGELTPFQDHKASLRLAEVFQRLVISATEEARRMPLICWTSDSSLTSIASPNQQPVIKLLRSGST